MSKTPRVVLGKITCQLKGCGALCVLKESETGKPYYACDECGSQHFSRGPRSIKLMRDAATLTAPAPAAAPAPEKKPAPTPAPKAAPKPAPKAKPDDQRPAPAARKPLWEL